MIEYQLLVKELLSLNKINYCEKLQGDAKRQMKETVLLFNISLRETRLKIGKALLPLNIAVKAVESKYYMESIGYLAGYKEMPAAGGTYDGNELEGEMIVMAGIHSAKVDLVLAALRKAGIPKSCLKAILTDTNRFWSAPRLYEELKKEHDTMSGI